MKMPLFLIAVIAAALFSLRLPTAALAQSPRSATLIVKITGLHSEKGQVRIAVFNTPESWLGDHPAHSATMPVEGPSLTWKLSGIPPGDYGLAVFHDENKNGKMDKNFLGIPQEAYGFSNNMRVRLGPPQWDRSKVVVKDSATEIAIEVK